MSDPFKERTISVLIPEFIKVEIGLDADTRALVTRYLDVKDQGPAIRKLTERLNTSTASLASAVAAHPDPDKTD